MALTGFKKAAAVTVLAAGLPLAGEALKELGVTNGNFFAQPANAQTVDLSRGRHGGMCLPFTGGRDFRSMLTRARVGISDTIREGVATYSGQARKQVRALESAVRSSGGRPARVSVTGTANLGKVWNTNQSGCRTIAQQTGKNTIYMNFVAGDKDDPITNTSPRVFAANSGAVLAR